MAERLRAAVSPYLRAHAGNPVDWYPWGDEAFAAAAERDVPVMISIGYATCHWCHVMARESFSDPVIAALLARDFVAIKVDREEHPDVDSSFMAAASAFTRGLGWPLTVFTTPGGRAFYAGTYFPPRPAAGTPSFAQVLEAVAEAWRDRRATLLETGDAVAEALAQAASADTAGALPDLAALGRAARELGASEDTRYGGFDTAPKFPVAPVLGFLTAIDGEGRALAARTLATMARSPLFDDVDGGFFRYATRADWSEPHYERMLSDNALLLSVSTGLSTGGAEPSAGSVDGGTSADAVGTAVAGFLGSVMRLPSGGFASAQDSESTIDGRRSEGGYYRADAVERRSLQPPALDDKVLTGWNGLAIDALAGFALRARDRTAAARALQHARGAAELLLAEHLAADGSLRRVSRDGVASAAVATLEDIGMAACGLIGLAVASGEVAYAVRARALVDRAMADAARSGADTAASPGGGPGAPFAQAARDEVLVGLGIALPTDPAEGAAPSGLTSCARAAWLLSVLGAGERYRRAAELAMEQLAGIALVRPMAFGAALELMARLARDEVQLVTVLPDRSDADADVPAEERLLVEETRQQEASVMAIVTEAQAEAFEAAGFELFAGRAALGGRATAYRCERFVCALPVHDGGALARLAPAYD